MSTPQDEPGSVRGTTLPEHARKIRELRKTLALTQPEFATKLNNKRGAVAQWEGGLREPRPKNYKALAALAESRSLPHLAEFFLSQIGKRKTTLRPDARERMEYVHAGRFLERTRREASGAGEWAERAQRLLSLSEMDGVEFAKLQAQKISEARRSLSNGEFEAALLDIVDETWEAQRLRRGRLNEAAAALKRLNRQYDQLLSAASLFTKNEDVMRGIIRNILADAEKAITDKTGRPEVLGVLSKIQRLENRSLRNLQRWKEVSKVLDKHADLAQDGKELPDDADVMRELTNLLRSEKRFGKKVNGQS